MKSSQFEFSPKIIGEVIKAKSDRIYRRERIKQVVTWFSFCLSISAIIIVFELKTYEKGSVVQLASINDQFEDILDIPQTQQPPPPPPAIQQPVIIEVPNEEEIDEEISIDLDIEMTEDQVIEDIIAFDEPEKEEAETIFQIVEETPSPQGGLQAFYRYLGKNLKYPAQARRMGVEGRVFLSFVVEKDGSLTDIQVMKGIGAGCDEESIRVMSNAPKWNPGKQRGVPVRVRYSFPIIFKLE
jgi:protein TonB